MRKYDKDEIEELNAEPWMIELLNQNPDYVFWGPHEDYMATKNDSGWNAPIFYGNWGEFNLRLDDLNECVNFYFELERSSVECEACDGQGVNPETLEISRSFYDFEGTGRKWCNSITQDEADHLWNEGRLYDFKEQPTAEQVNEWNQKRMGHDAINRWMLIKVRANRLGVYGECEVCKGNGRLWTEETAHVNLVLWIIHPRKGASRGAEIKYIQHEDLPKIAAFLKEAAQRNMHRFSKIENL